MIEQHRVDTRKTAMSAWSQVGYFRQDVSRAVNRRWWRLFTLLFSPAMHAVAIYRADRFMYLMFGRSWSALRILLLPISFLLRPWVSGLEIHYTADIGGGLLILHPSMGVVISGYAVCGGCLTLVGGNCIGGRARLRVGDLRVGDDVLLGVNSVILGPAVLGDRVRIGAGAVVIGDAPDGAVLVGVPARRVDADEA